MKKIKQIFFLICSFVLLIACGPSNSLKQSAAENTIKEFVAINTFQTPNENVSTETLQKIEDTNIYSQFDTSVRVNFSKEGGKTFTLLFIFTRTTDNKWFLQSVEASSDVTLELLEWLSAKTKLNIAVK